MRPLLVMVPDHLSELVQKGEITARYYNPGELFDEVHLLMTNADRPDAAALQKTVGRAALHLHNLPADKKTFARSLGFRPFLLESWAAPAVDLARRIGPAMIRCHGNYLNAFAASVIKRKLGVPYVVSLHINRDEDMRGRASSLKDRLYTNATRDIERISLRHADLVLPVYQPIVPYLQNMGVSHYEVAYNVLNPEHLRKKDDYALHDPVRVISVGRQFREKNPENLIRAVARIPGAHLTLVGDGEYHGRLVRAAQECGAPERISFETAIPNDVLCRSLPEYDIFATHTEFWEISKSVLEPLLTGLPVVLNRRAGRPVPELQGDHVMLVDNTEEAWRAAIEKLIADHAFREKLGRTAYAHAQERWAPHKTEARFADIYRKVMKQAEMENTDKGSA